MISDLRHVLSLQQKTMTPDGGGGFSITWSNVASNPVLHAGIIAMGGPKRFMHRQFLCDGTVKMRIRYRDDVTDDMRLTDGSRHYYIQSVQDSDGKKAFLDIIAEKR